MGSRKTQEHVTRSFKKHLNMTPTVFINNLRLNKAAFLLTSTDKSIFDISFVCGFESISYFNRLFKEKYYFSPNKYRKTIHTVI
jgi:AraC family cel operon transcriptional repressor